MPFYRFEKLKTHHFNPHLSATTGPIIEGEYMFFRRVRKPVGGKTTLHYHPNEFMAFLLEGRFNCVVGEGRRTVRPGTLVHIPSNAQHCFSPQEDIKYLYVKDRTWTMIGQAADEALPDKARSVVAVAKDIAAGKYPGGKKEPGKSKALVKGVGDCFHALTDGLDGARKRSAHCERWVEGANLAFGFAESPGGYTVAAKKAPHELFAYVMSGALDARVGGRKQKMGPGDVIHVPRGSEYGWSVRGRGPARYAMVRSTTRLEEEVDRTGASDNWRG